MEEVVCPSREMRNRKMREKISTIGARGDLNLQSGLLDLMRENFKKSSFRSLEHGGSYFPKS